MYRALRPIAPQQTTGRFVERQQCAVFAAEVYIAILRHRLAAKHQRKRDRPQHATSSLVECVGSTIAAAGEDLSAAECERAAQRPDQRSHPLRHAAFTTECTQRARRRVWLSDSRRRYVDRTLIGNRRRRKFATHV